MLLPLLATIFVGAAIATFAYATRKGSEELLVAIEGNFQKRLRRLRVKVPALRYWLIGWAGFVLAVFITLSVVFEIPILGIAIAGLLTALPWQVIKRMAEKRRMMIEDEMADAMVQLSSAIRAGLSLAQSIDILAQQTPFPINQEFQQMSGEYQLGKPLERCLHETKERLDSENFALFAAAMEASRESGGRLNETVERIAYSVRELQRLERKVVAETAQARASASYMALAPFVILAIYFFIVDPDNTRRLFTEVWGQIMLSVAIVLDVIAYFWARSILNPDI